MTLFPNEDVLTTKEIESWKGFANSLHGGDNRELFMSMLNDYYKYAAAIKAKDEPFPSNH
jgi:hypothetical protein